MAKDLNEQEGAVADSVSLEEVETQETMQESEVNASTDKFINECKDFIVNYAKTCYDYPEDQAYALREFFISSYLDAFDSDADALSGELPQDDYLQYLEEKLYQYACNLHLNRPLDLADAMTTLGVIANKLYSPKK